MPLNKYRNITICLLCLLVIAVVFATMFAPMGREMATVSPELAKKLSIAIEADAPRVSLQGVVYLPDGSLASECHIVISSVAFFRQDYGTTMPPSCYISTGGSSGSVKSDGTFQIDNQARIGSNTVLTVYGWTGRKNERFLSKPVVMVPHELQAETPLVITLEEGIPVRGKIMYDNDTPAANRSLEFVQHVEPILGADIPEMQNALRSSRWMRTNEAGELETFLLPGEYTVRDDRQTQTLTIAATDTEKQLAWTMPTPIFIEIEKEDGLPPDRVDYSFYRPENNSMHSSASNDKGSIVLDPITEDAVLYLSDRDKMHGTVETITPDMVGKTIRFTLKPMAHVTATLVGPDGKPAVGQRVSLSIQFSNPKDQSTVAAGIGSAVTDSEGKATIPVAAGKIPIVLRLSDAQYELPIPTGGIEIRFDFGQEINLSPGETFDFGTVRLRESRPASTPRPATVRCC